MNEYITLNHGNGGRQTNLLIKNLFASKFGYLGPLTDSVTVDFHGGKLAFTTDSYVIDPVFFPGGNIGKLAVCGTVNDLAVSAAEPKFISASFIIEEGFPLSELETIAQSMADEAENAGVKIVTGDTKVVEKGKCDRLFINTSGIGIVKQGFEHVSTGKYVKAGDSIIINGTVGNHALAVMGARNKLSFTTALSSDCASLNHLICRILDNCRGIRFMRDLTRGGLAAVLNELSEMIHCAMTVNEQDIPVDEQVKGLCEMLGFDPLYLANEGKFIIVADQDDVMNILNILRSDPLGKASNVIGQVELNNNKYNNINNNLYNNIIYSVTLNTITGGKRIIDMPSGAQLPRIC